MRFNLVSWMQLSSREWIQQFYSQGSAVLFREGSSVLFWVLLLFDHPTVSSFSCTPRCLFLRPSSAHIPFFPKQSRRSSIMCPMKKRQEDHSRVHQAGLQLPEARYACCVCGIAAADLRPSLKAGSRGSFLVVWLWEKYKVACGT